MRTIIRKPASSTPSTLSTPAPAAEVDHLESFIGTAEERAKKSKKKKPNPGSSRRLHIEDVERRIREQDWSGATAKTLVGLYWTCHVKVYGVTPIELDNAITWQQAMKCAGTLVKRHFDGDVQAAIKFMRWLWTREASKMQWAQKQGFTPNRITWNRQFAQSNYVTDYRAEKLRRQA